MRSRSTFVALCRRFGSSAVLLGPTVRMGATLPVLSRADMRDNLAAILEP